MKEREGSGINFRKLLDVRRVAVRKSKARGSSGVRREQRCGANGIHAAGKHSQWGAFRALKESLHVDLAL